MTRPHAMQNRGRSVPRRTGVPPLSAGAPVGLWAGAEDPPVHFEGGDYQSGGVRWFPGGGGVCALPKGLEGPHRGADGPLTCS